MESSICPKKLYNRRKFSDPKSHHLQIFLYRNKYKYLDWRVFLDEKVDAVLSHFLKEHRLYALLKSDDFFTLLWQIILRKESYCDVLQTTVVRTGCAATVPLLFCYLTLYFPCSHTQDRIKSGEKLGGLRQALGIGC